MAHATESVKGRVKLVTTPSPLEYAEAYEKTDDVDFCAELESRQKSAGIARVIVPFNAVVELQTIPDFKVIAKSKVDKNGLYCFNVKEDNRDWRVYCKCELEEFGRRIPFIATAHVKWDKRENAYVQNLWLRRDYVSVVGRCVDTNGVPVANAVISVGPTTTVDEGRSPYDDQIARSDSRGYWRVDGVITPSLNHLMILMGNTKQTEEYDSGYIPYGINVGAKASYFAAKGTSDTIGLPNLSANARIATEKIFAAFKRKTGKDWPRPHPLMNFPVSTNNVIYVPDIVLK